MKTVGRTKVSVSLPGDLVQKIDEAASVGKGSTRSGVMEAWLREAERGQARSRLEEETEAYYGALKAEEKAEDAGWAEMAAKAFGEVTKKPARPKRKRATTRRKAS